MTSEESQTCPRRMGEVGSWDHEEGLDSWRGGAVGLSCSFCGSLHPGRFMELVREGWIVGPTDKSYKAYLSQPLSDAEKADRKARWMQGFTAAEIQATARERGETPEQAQEALSGVYDTQIAPTEAGGAESKFYFQHLSPVQQDEFIELHNTKQMNIGYPGYFYQLPFFCAPRPEPA